MKKQQLKQVRPEDFDVQKLLVAAREGRLYIDVGSVTVSRESLVNSVFAYVEQIGCFVTQSYSSRVGELWKQILAKDDFVDYLMPGTKARRCKEFNKYNVMRIIGVLREKGVYEQYSDRKYDVLLERKESPYRKYLGMGIEERHLLIKLREIVENFEI